MRVNLKQGRLFANLSKRELKTLVDAKEICQMVSNLSPIEEELKQASRASGETLGEVLIMFGVVKGG